MGGGVAFALVAVLVGIAVGPAPIGIDAIVEAAASHVPFIDVRSHLSASDSAIVWELRLPRVVLGLLVGAMLSCAGATYQGVFRNPLVDPYLLGVAAGAGLGATLMIAYAPGQAFDSDLLPVAAFAGGAIAVVIAYAIGRSSRWRASATIVPDGGPMTPCLTS